MMKRANHQVFLKQNRKGKQQFGNNSLFRACKLFGVYKRGAGLLGVGLMLGLLLCGCGEAKTTVEKVKDLEYTVVGQDEQPENLVEILEEKKKLPFEMTYLEEGSLYICVGYGEQTTGGYSIQVDDCYLGENEIYLNTTLLGPTTQEQQEEVLSYPILVIKTEEMDLPVIFE